MHRRVCKEDFYYNQILVLEEYGVGGTDLPLDPSEARGYGGAPTWCSAVASGGAQEASGGLVAEQRAVAIVLQTSADRARSVVGAAEHA